MKKSSRAKTNRPIRIGKVGVVYQSDALKFLRRQPGESASLIFLDPPFNLGKRYGRSGSRRDGDSEGRYFRTMLRVMDECERVLEPGGSLYLYHLPRWAMLLGRHMVRSLEFRHWIAVSMKNGFVTQGRLYPAHYALLMFSKGTPKRFARPKTPVQKCRHCGEPIKDYGGYKHFVRRGINLSDIWDDFSPVRHRRKKHRIANELPLPLLRRVVRISGHRGGVLVDPFVGTGTSLAAAVERGMTFVAADREESACRIAARRVRNHVRQMMREKR